MQRMRKKDFFPHITPDSSVFYAIMELEKERLKREKQREARRRRILANSEARMKKLRSMGERSARDNISENEGDIPRMAPSVDETHMQCKSIEYAADPPDELIVRQPVPSTSRKASNKQLGNSGGGASQLSHVVAVLQSNKVFRIRTAVAILCSLVVTIQNAKTVHPISYVLCQLALDGCILSWVFITLPSVSFPSPLGRLSVAKLALIYLHPSLGAVFETICLLLCLSGAVLRDLCTMLFFLVLSVSIPVIII